MAHEETVMELMNHLVIADKHVIGDLMAHKELWTKGTSAVNNSYKALNLLVDSGKLVKGENSSFRLPECRSTYQPHARLLTIALAQILKLNLNAKIFREVNLLKEVGLRPDSLVLLNKGNQYLMFILEICNNEEKTYLEQKIHTLKNWDGALQAFSLLFETRISAFDIVVSGDISADETFEFNSYLEEVKK